MIGGTQGQHKQNRNQGIQIRQRGLHDLFEGNLGDGAGNKEVQSNRRRNAAQGQVDDHEHPEEQRIDPELDRDRQGRWVSG